MRNLLWKLSFVTLVPVLGGCGHSKAVTDVAIEQPTTLLVDNQAFTDMTIYVLEGSRRVRLGMAGGHAETRFTIPKYLVRSITSLRFLADPIGSDRTPVSDEIQVNPGDQVVLRIPPV